MRFFSEAARRFQARRSDDSGFGLVEILVSMFILSIISLAMLPIFINTLQLSSRNVSLTTATQLVSEQMDVARALAPTCVAIQTYATETNGMFVEDPRGNILQIHRQAPATCPSAYPAGFAFTSWVTLQGDVTATPIASGETRIYIKSTN
jgi:prepilin-type N-terminal cleavage/methylation domain-containing protein